MLSPQNDAHSHSFLGDDHDENARRTRWVVILTLVMMVVEIVAGYTTGSMALLADGFHMATHAGALGIAAAAYAYARRNATNEHFSFGTGKVGDLAGFASALILALVSLGIGFESLHRLLNPANVAFAEAAGIATVGLVVNIVSAFLLGGGHHHAHDHSVHPHPTHSHQVHPHPTRSHPTHSHQAHPPTHHHSHQAGADNNIRAAYVHVLADALTSVLAIIALLAGRYFGWIWLDPLMGIAGAIVIARWSVVLLKASAAVLLDVTDEQVANEIRHKLEPGGNIEITDLHVWQVGPQARAAIVSVTGRGVTAAQIRQSLRDIRAISHLTVECRSA